MVVKLRHRTRSRLPDKHATGRPRPSRTKKRVSRTFRGGKDRRRGVASIDYVLVLGIILPLAAFLYRVVPKIINLVYDMVTVLTVWPFP